MKADVINLENKKSGSIDLPDEIFDLEVRGDILARCVNWQLAKRRAGTHKVKTRGEVAATKTKPFRQKGTGRARQGFRRAAQMRGGGIVFGPTPRDHGHGLPKKVRKLALKTALSAKQKEGRLFVVDTLKLDEPKTGALKKRLDAFDWGRTLVIDGAEVEATFARAARNLIGIDVLPSGGANVYDILRRDTLVLTKDAVEKLVERLS